MERVTGIGGVFFKSPDPESLRESYAEHLGVTPGSDGSVAFEWRGKNEPERVGYTVWAPFKHDTSHFDPNRGREHMRRGSLKRAINWAAALAVVSASAAPAPAQTVSEMLDADVAPGAATLWYLGHAGWAVKTRSRLLIFDYWESHEPPRNASLANGFIDAAEIAGQRTIVFVTHQHGDHYDPKIFHWADSIGNITYVFGWNVTTDRPVVRMLGLRQTRQIDGVVVATINHEFDNVAEVAFMVEVDGLVIYHSGDHGTVTDDPNPVFIDNIDYLSSLGKRIDIAFVSTFGRIGGGMVNAGDRYTIEKLSPKSLFPMHHGDNEDLYERFAHEIENDGVKTAVHYADGRGDCFTYVAGRVRKN